MQVRELRIGNYIQDINHPERICRVFRLTSGIDFTITYHYGRSCEESYAKASQDIFIQPIPLTEEWLVKFGFEDGPSKGGFALTKNKLSIHLPDISYPQGRTYFNSWCIIDHSVKYVHQLQNLYFSLTGEELTIK